MSRGYHLQLAIEFEHNPACNSQQQSAQDQNAAGNMAERDQPNRFERWVRAVFVAFKARCRADKEIGLSLRTLERGLATLQLLTDFLAQFSVGLAETGNDRRQKLRGMKEGFVEGPWTQIIPSELFHVDYERIADIFMRLSQYGIFRVAPLDNIYAAVSEDLALCQGVLAGCAIWLQGIHHEHRMGFIGDRLNLISNEIMCKIAAVGDRLRNTGLSLNAMYLKASVRWQAIQQHIQIVHLHMGQADNYLATQILRFWRLQSDFDRPEEWDVDTAEKILYPPYCVLLKDSAGFYDKHWRILRRLGLELINPDVMESGLPVLSVN